MKTGELIKKITVENVIGSIGPMLANIEGDGPTCMNPMLKLDYTDINNIKYVIDSAFYSDETQEVLGRVNDLLDWIGVNVDENGDIARRFGITGIPTTVFVRNDNLINKVVGLMNYNSMKNILEKLKSRNN